MNKRMEQYWREKSRESLLRGYSATFENSTLKIFDPEGNKFDDFSIGASTGWKSGNFTFKGQVLLSWDWSTKRKKHNPKIDCWSYHGQVMCDMINRYGQGGSIAL
jgi:hypothetical protein